MTWTEDEVKFLIENYPTHGKQWCAEKLNKTEPSIRAKAQKLGLRIDQDSEFFKEWQSRAAKSKIGKKRPDQAEFMKKQWKNGAFDNSFPPERRKRMSSRQREWLNEHGHPKGFLGHRHTEGSKKLMSDASRKTWERIEKEELVGDHVLKMMKTKYARGVYISPRTKVTWKGGSRDIGGHIIYMRSRWEANYARFLEFRKQHGEIKDWEHEPDVFWFEGVKRGCVSYLPDFKVTLNDGSVEYHEVKGWMDQKSKTKLNRMKKYYPDVKVVVIDGKYYRDLEKKIGGAISGWEFAD